MKGSRLLWALLLLSVGGTTVVTSTSSPVCDSRCVCYDDISSNLNAANCSNVHYDGKSFLHLLKNVKILRIHDGNENGGIFSETWSSCNNLEELYVKDNRQTSINLKTLKNCKKLRVLDVSNNKISKVSQINFLLKELPNLERLVLQGNPITALPDLTSSSLTFLDLSYCNLNIVGEKSFAKLRKLHTLNLEGNKLKKFKSALPGSIRVLNLILNDIATISPVEHFAKLKVLELAGNPLQCSCDLVRLRNEESAEFVSSRQEVTCAGPKTMRGLSWAKARKQCELGKLLRRQRRDLDDLEEEGSGFDEYTDNSDENSHVDAEQEGNTDGDDGDSADGDNEIEEDSDKDSDPIAAPAEEKTESPDNEETKLVDSKLFGTVEEPNENAQGEVGNNFFETDHSTSSTTEHEFIPHENETDDDSKEDETIVGGISENSDTKDDTDPEVTENDETKDTGSEKQVDNDNEEEEDEDDDDDDDDDEITDQAAPEKSEISEVNAAEKETETDKQETDDKEDESNVNYDITGSEDDTVNKESEQDEDSKDKEKGDVKIDNISENHNNGDYVDYEYSDKTDGEKPDESPTENTPLIVGDDVEENKGVDVNESWSEGNQPNTDETSTSKWNHFESDLDEASGFIGETEGDEEISPIIEPGGDNDTIPSVEDVFYKKFDVDLESVKETDSETETGLEDTGFEGSATDSEDAEPEVTPSTVNVTAGRAGHGRKIFLGEPGVKEDGEVSQATTQPGPGVSQEETEKTAVPVVPQSEDTNEKISLESPESPVTSTGSYVVLGLIMVLIVFLLGYAVYKSRLGRRRSDGDSRTIKEKDVELGKGNDRELQDVSKPLLVTTPAAAVNGKSELQQPLVSKPTENPQLKDDAEDKKKNSSLQSKYHIYDTLNGDKERIEVPPPTNATVPVSTSPKKSPSPTRAVSKLPPPRDGDSPGPNMYGGDDNDDGEVFLKNNQNGDLGSPRSCRVTVVQGDLSVPKKPVFVVNPGVAASSGVV